MSKRLCGAAILFCSFAAIYFSVSWPGAKKRKWKLWKPSGSEKAWDVLTVTTTKEPLVILTTPKPLPAVNYSSHLRRRRSKSTETTTTTAAPVQESTTSTPIPIFNGIEKYDAVPFFSIKDSVWYKQWTSRQPGKALPRVLIYTWVTEEIFHEYVNEVYWKACYAHSHGFDVVFSTRRNNYKTTQVWPMFKHLGYTMDEMNKWAWVYGVLEYITTGAYEYVFMMRHDVLIQESHFDFPVWAWDQGHHFTIMDQYHFLWPEAYGLNINDVLWKATWYSKKFLEDLFEYRNGFYLQGDVGPFMETILRFLGSEGGGYDKKCWRFLNLNKPFTRLMETDPKRHELLQEYFSQCFFTELERLIGVFGQRKSQNIGFTPTFVTNNFQKLIPEQLRWMPGVLGPWANCWRNVRKFWPNPSQNCFALHWKGDQEMLPSDQPVRGTVVGQCPDPTFNWTGSPYNPNNRGLGPRLEKGSGVRTLVQNERAKFVVSDAARLEAWAQRISAPSLRFPRVLIYTWCAEDTYNKYVNEVYWKTCYASAHGFNIVYSATTKISGVKQWSGPHSDDYGFWYAYVNPWAWIQDIQTYLFSGEYDYVLMMSRDTLIQESFFDFPAWDWDRGHDITVMDQHHFEPPESYGFEMNNILFKPTDFTKEFLDELYKYRKGFYLQDVNGAYMETILTFLGREASASGSTGYNGTCLKHLALDQPDFVAQKSNQTSWMRRKDLYSVCFFDELDRLAGGYGSRASRNLGFTPCFVVQNGAQVLPSGLHSQLGGWPGPWASCWSGPRNRWTTPDTNCFSYHWNEPNMDSNLFNTVKGQCPDLTFRWYASLYNPANRRPLPS